MNRDQAYNLLSQHIQADNLIKHCLATEAIMRALAEQLGHDADQWGLAGLLHDLDYNQTAGQMDQHGLVTAQILAPTDVDPAIISAIKAHNAENLGLTRQTEFDFALTAAETMTGLIVATALVYPDKKIASVKVSSVTKRMKEKHFARNVNRDFIMLCERLGLSLDDFTALSIQAMSGISAELGL